MTTTMESTNGRQARNCDGGSTTPLVTLASLVASIPGPSNPLMCFTNYSTSSIQRARSGLAEVRAGEGYFDHVAAVFSANQHPIIFVDEAAMRWMGAHVCPEDNFDLLVKDNQFDDILADFLGTRMFEFVEQERWCRLLDSTASRIPRLRYIDDQHQLHYSCLNLWPESVYMLSITSTGDELVEVQDVVALNPNLVEERFDPSAGKDSSLSTHTGKLARGCPIFRPVHGLSAKFKCPLYIPSLPCFIDALLDQIRCRKQAHPVGREFHPALPSYHVSNLIRYLHLEKPSQREKLLPMLAERNRADMEIRLNRFKRKIVVHFPTAISSKQKPEG